MVEQLFHTRTYIINLPWLKAIAWTARGSRKGNQSNNEKETSLEGFRG